MLPSARLGSRGGRLRAPQASAWLRAPRGAASQRLSTQPRTNVWQDPQALKKLAAYKASPQPTPDELRLLKDIENRCTRLRTSPRPRALRLLANHQTSS